MRKKYLFVVSLAVMMLTGSELYSQIEVRGQFGMSRIEGENELLLSFDGRYFVDDQFAVGVHFPIILGDFANVTGYTAMVEYYFTDDELQPYVGFSAGMYRMTASSFGMTFSSTDLGVNPRGGVRYALNEQFGVFGEVGYRRIFGDASANVFDVGVGVSVRF